MSNDNYERFDMNKRPVKCRWFLKPVAWAICLPGILRHKPQIIKEGLDGLKPPYLLLGNHNAFFDMKVSALGTFPHFGNYVVAIDGFIGREGLLRQIGCICKRKFTSSISVIRNLQHVIAEKGIAVVYPEARYSLCGTTAPLPESLGKLCKLLDVPVVTIICHGHHINHPFWNTRKERGVKHTQATMRLLFTKDQVEKLTVGEINSRIVEEFQYDDFAWQLKNKTKIEDPQRAVGLEKILYQCPHCKKEFEMLGSGTTLKCNSCGKTWTMTEYGQLIADDGETEFAHIPDWYEWERENVKAEVAAGSYSTGVMKVNVESLPNADGFIPLGEGTMIHDMNGFKVEVGGEADPKTTMIKPVQSLYSCHVEYEYLFRHGDCVDLNTLDDTWYVYPKDCKFSVTKIALATEELYYDYKRRQGKPCLKGLA